MNLRFLGTGFGITKIKKRATKDYRRPASLLIDEKILIDPTNKIFEFIDDYSMTGLLRDVHTVLVTSADEVRICSDTLMKMAGLGRPYTVYGDESILPYIPTHPKISFRAIRPNEIFDAESAKIIALPTIFKTDEGNSCIGYAICTDRSLLYLPDGGFLHPDAWALMKKLHFDHAVLGCPEGDKSCSINTVERANFALASMLHDIFVDAKMLSDKSRCFLTSLPADKKRSIHDALLSFCKDAGFTIAYDGLYMTV